MSWKAPHCTLTSLHRRLELQKFDFKSLADLASIEANKNVDAIGEFPRESSFRHPTCSALGAGIVTKAEQATDVIAKKSGTHIRKRNITLRDDSNKQIEVTLWGHIADQLDLAKLGAFPVLALKGARISEFGG